MPVRPASRLNVVVQTIKDPSSPAIEFLLERMQRHSAHPTHPFDDSVIPIPVVRPVFFHKLRVVLVFQQVRKELLYSLAIGDAVRTRGNPDRSRRQEISHVNQHVLETRFEPNSFGRRKYSILIHRKFTRSHDFVDDAQTLETILRENMTKEAPYTLNCPEDMGNAPRQGIKHGLMNSSPSSSNSGSSNKAKTAGLSY